MIVSSCVGMISGILGSTGAAIISKAFPTNELITMGDKVAQIVGDFFVGIVTNATALCVNTCVQGVIVSWTK